MKSARPKLRWEQKIAYDTRLNKPANPEIQRRLGCAITGSYLFPEKTWLPVITPDMIVLTLTEEETEELIDMVRVCS